MAMAHMITQVDALSQHLEARGILSAIGNAILVVLLVVLLIGVLIGFFIGRAFGRRR
ncbi:hypothetical protein [Solihabitans fulvus]|uniref:hypothetical protein n=1 Tax=Solihabitans fulvus TaxID=1892852 RepID=UPI0016620D91|nr:hypothetical protein [Solihabitans fulvus]